MARAVYPIVDIVAGAKESFPLSFADIFQSEGAARDDEFTFTARFEVPAEGAVRDRIRIRLRAGGAREKRSA